jgi:predicted MPP superfamily phosphohydrolase
MILHKPAQSPRGHAIFTYATRLPSYLLRCMNAATSRTTTHYRAVFISDIHLGTRGCRADFLVDFLRRTSCDQLYLVGDIIDGWRLRKSWYWDTAHDEVLRLILRHARAGTQVTYIPGNHDEMFRDWLPLNL